MSATTNLGKVSVTPKGAWANTNTYEILDIVTSGGSSYLAKQDVPVGVSLSNTSYWIMIAEKGDGGEVTSASASISGGYGTPGVTVTAGGTAHERTLAFAFTNLRGEKGETGNGIDSVYKTGTSGLVDTYTILFTDGSTYEFEVNNGTASIDDTLTKSGWAADAKVVGDTKASIDGFYETMGVGVADNLTPYSEDSGATQDIPFIAQGTGCGNGESVVDTGSYLQFKKKLGNTVAVNQFVGSLGSVGVTQNCTKSYNSGTGVATFTPTNYASDNVGVYGISSARVGRKYIISMQIKLGKAANVRFAFGGNSETKAIAAGSYVLFQRIATATSTGSLAFYVECGSAGWSNETFEVKNLWGIDLTVWYGSNDRIPSDLLAHPENWGRYYAGSLDYAAGYLDSADGTVMRSIGRNIFNEQTERADLDWSTYKFTSNASGGRLCPNDFIEVIPNAQYYITAKPSWGIVIAGYSSKTSNGTPLSLSYNIFTVPSNIRYIKFGVLVSDYGSTYNNDITVSLYYPGESGYDQYYPFSVLAEVDTGSEALLGYDWKEPNGTIHRDTLPWIDLGTLTPVAYTSTIFRFEITGRKYGRYNLRCSRYVVSSANVKDNMGDKEIIGFESDAPYIYICDSAFSGYTIAQIQAALSGVYVECEAATPTTEQGTAFAENIPCDDFGSLMWTQTKGIPQGNEIFYPVDYKASFDTLYNLVEGDMSAIATDDELQVVADRVPDAPSTDGTYSLKVSVSGGTKTYSWVADE